MISAIVLAAGLSSRMGTSKPLLPFGGRTVIEHIVFRLFKTGVEDIAVITGHEGDGVVDALAGLPVRLVHNFGYEQGGMLSSVKTGIQAVSLGGSGDKNDAGTGTSTCRAALLCLGDQPAIESGIVSLLVETFEGGARNAILVPSHGQRGGHPILVPAAFFAPILALPPQGSLRDLLKDPATPVQHIEVESDSVLREFNTPEEYEQELARLGKESR